MVKFFTSDFEMCIQMINDTNKQFNLKKQKIIMYIIKAKCLNKSNKTHDFQQAKEILLKLIGYLNKNIDKLIIGKLYSELIVTYSHLNLFNEAKESYKNAEKYLIDSKSKIDLVHLWRKSLIFFEFETAEIILIKAIKICNLEKFDIEKLKIYNNLAVIYLNNKKLDKSYKILIIALKLNIKYGRDYILNNIGIYYIKKRNFKKAYEVLYSAKNSSNRSICNIIISTNIAALELAEKKIIQSEESFNRLLIDANLTNEDVYTIIIRFNLIEIYLLKNNVHLALKELRNCNLFNLNNLGDYYFLIKKKLLLKILLQLDACKKDKWNFDFIETQKENFYYIEMEFWGD